jgi:soluble lytic murein transglycosylase
MITRGLIVGLAAALLTVSHLWAGLEELARSEDWARVLQVAARRADQLPLSQGENLIAAHAARMIGDRGAEERFLAEVAAGEDVDLVRLAEVQLAALVREEQPETAVDLVLPSLRDAPSWQVREAATQSATEGLLTGVGRERRAALEAAVRRMPRSLRRRLELGLSVTDDNQGRKRLEQLLAASTSDLVALEAAAALAEYPDPSPTEQWRVAKTLYRHARYEEAIPWLDGVWGERDTAVPREEVAYLRGRCAFRRGRFEEAIVWYARAIPLARRAERRAELETHLGRSHELRNEMDEAVKAAQRAVRIKTTDDRRLFLARLRLRRDEPELAAKGISHLRGRSARSRGQMMLALDALRRGEAADARRRLAQVRRRPWAGPSAVVAAQLAAAGGEMDVAVTLLEGVASLLGPYWSGQARDVMSAVPEALITKWRQRRRKAVEEAAGRTLRTSLGRWAVLEPDGFQMADLRRRVAAEYWPEGDVSEPEFSAGLAGRLWAIGLRGDAARWDPSGFPRGGVVSATWSAARLIENHVPWSGLRTADGAWRSAGAEIPVRTFPDDLQRSLYPLPQRRLVTDVASDAEVPWTLVAAVAREESRWDPRAVSAVGARGLVQLMPATAVQVAVRQGVPEPTPEDLFDPSINLELGAAEIARLLGVFAGRRAPAIAAYNAGETQAALWLDQCGADCSEELYLLNISFSSTRAYTAAVLASAASYGVLYPEVERPHRDAAKVSGRTESPRGAPWRVAATVRSPR